ncbi:MAG: SIR2 family protein, partial [Gammaproteobacteria bacterium]|nr:SIR2 family protein [Gammaproteobacteria bacterium]
MSNSTPLQDSRQDVWCSDDIPEELLLQIARGAVFPFIGAGFSKNASDEYPNSVELATKLAVKLSPASQVDTNDLLAVADCLVKEGHSLRELHDTICDLCLPSHDVHGKSQELLVRLPWRRIYTTNYDMLIEKAGDEHYVSVATRQRYREWRLRHRIMVMKLCGDRDHMMLMRVTSARLAAESLLEEIPELFDDLVNHLDGGCFLYLGYSFGDPFMNSALQWVWFGAMKQGMKEHNIPHSYIPVFEPPNDIKRNWMEKNRLSPILMYELSDNKKTAIERFLLAATDYYQALLEKQAGEVKTLLYKLTPREETPMAKEVSEEYDLLLLVSQRVPVFMTDGEGAKGVLERVVLPACEKLGKDPTISTVRNIEDLEKVLPSLDEILAKSYCAVLIFGGRSLTLERLAERAVQQRCRTIILCDDEMSVGYYTRHMRYHGFREEGLVERVGEELSIATVEARFTRSEELFDARNFDMVLVDSWIACEQTINKTYIHLIGGASHRVPVMKQLESI